LAVEKLNVPVLHRVISGESVTVLAAFTVRLRVNAADVPQLGVVILKVMAYTPGVVKLKFGGVAEFVTNGDTGVTPAVGDTDQE
jgi:hypothetical protein